LDDVPGSPHTPLRIIAPRTPASVAQ
jgi:hypothetical protein